MIAYELQDQKIKIIKTRNGTIRVLEKDELIKMKADSGRRQDVEDIKALQDLDD